jgi:hypothetical protein
MQQHSGHSPTQLTQYVSIRDVCSKLQVCEIDMLAFVSAGRGGLS